MEVHAIDEGTGEERIENDRVVVTNSISSAFSARPLGIISLELAIEKRSWQWAKEGEKMQGVYDEVECRLFCFRVVDVGVPRSPNDRSSSLFKDCPYRSVPRNQLRNPEWERDVLLQSSPWVKTLLPAEIPNPLYSFVTPPDDSR